MPSFIADIIRNTCWLDSTEPQMMDSLLKQLLRTDFGIQPDLVLWLTIHLFVVEVDIVFKFMSKFLAQHLVTSGRMIFRKLFAISLPH